MIPPSCAVELSGVGFVSLLQVVPQLCKNFRTSPKLQSLSVRSSSSQISSDPSKNSPTKGSGVAIRERAYDDQVESVGELTASVWVRRLRPKAFHFRVHFYQGAVNNLRDQLMSIRRIELALWVISFQTGL